MTPATWWPATWPRSRPAATSCSRSAAPTATPSPRGFGTYSSTGAAKAYNHSVAEFAGFFGPLPLVPPGVADAREWHPDDEQPTPLPPRPGQSLVGVARVG